ncbi:class I SAM-dependent methyltransferase [Pseudomonas sp. RIT-PI-S]|uniref:class I SAM-dependent methyltransferase n=1 Tax=Pseudomonas sp. RIT-PI-S TaxID=3035295 RepID=UPI0021D91AF5|nr:class I SAM-dependent methyltransferase [Pseudomonas sp. RIT-PI-S]
MDPRSEVLLRQAHLFQGRLLLVGLPADGLLDRLPDTHGWSWNAADHAALTLRHGERANFGVSPPEGDFHAAVVFLPKARELAAYVLNALASRLAGRSLFLVGEKRGGIEGAARQLAAFGRPRKLDSARHCQLWQVDVDQAPTEPHLNSLAQRFTLELEGAEPLNVVSLPGVFSHGRLDRGTRLLLGQLDGLPAAHLLDFGCGAGVIGAVLKRRYPQARVSLLDVDAFAIASARLTLEANGLEGELICADGIGGAPQGLSAIISNPPFHTGVHTDYRASEALLQRAASHLAPGGEIRLVANSFLRYQPLLEAHLRDCSVLAEGDGFRVYRALR